MLKVEAIKEAAKRAAEHAMQAAEEGDFRSARLCLIESAVYSVGAEICGRLENLHFDSESIGKDGLRFFFTEGQCWIKKPEEDKDDKSTSADSNIDPQGPSPAGSSVGDGGEST